MFKQNIQTKRSPYKLKRISRQTAASESSLIYQILSHAVGTVGWSVGVNICGNNVGVCPLSEDSSSQAIHVPLYFSCNFSCLQKRFINLCVFKRSVI